LQERKLPERKCLGCGETKLKRDMIRVVRSPQGDISLDFIGKKSGRGAYVCPSLSCLKKARKARRLEHQLKVSIPDQIYDALEAQMQNGDA